MSKILIETTTTDIAIPTSVPRWIQNVIMAAMYLTVLSPFLPIIAIAHFCKWITVVEENCVRNDRAQTEPESRFSLVG